MSGDAVRYTAQYSYTHSANYGTAEPCVWLVDEPDAAQRGTMNDTPKMQTSIIEVASPTDSAADSDADEESRIDAALLEETLEYIRPALQADGGDLVLMGTKGGTVTLQLVGACGGCPMSTMTLTAGIERILRDRVPGVEEVVAL